MSIEGNRILCRARNCDRYRVALATKCFLLRLKLLLQFAIFRLFFAQIQDEIRILILLCLAMGNLRTKSCPIYPSHYICDLLDQTPLQWFLRKYVSLAPIGAPSSKTSMVNIPENGGTCKFRSSHAGPYQRFKYFLTIL